MTAPGGASTPVAVVFGGPSAEHDVSIVSGTAIAEALAAKGHAVSQFLVDLSGGWWRMPAGHRREGRPGAAYDAPASLGAAGPFTAGEATVDIAAARPRPVVFIALHGPFGEDGTIQAILEAAGLAYTGAGIAASAVGMDKPFFKRIARGAGLPVLPWIEISATRWAADRSGVLADLEAFAADAPGRRVIVKPARLGSSVGMSIAWGPADRGPAVELALRYDARILVEPCLPTPRELEVAVLGNAPGDLAVYGPGEVIPSRDFYDYVDKYVADAAVLLPRADVDDATAADCRRIAAAAFTLIGAEGMARVDFLQDRGSGSLYLNEINTIPGFTPISLFPRVAAAAGLAFPDLCARIVALAVERHAAVPGSRLTAKDL
ncbi:MAG: D-alanine--D-alanine ligase, partial [Candidatus Limnocylindrales bacterium]|nr:D-alanine--D-alanine ligase [Candidatus Limnocylindrales bacterium]